MNRWRDQVAACTERVVGRQNLVRSARFLLDYARRDVPNRIDSNGELVIQRAVALERLSLVVFDVGANVGQWSSRLLTACRNAGVCCGELHVFEPAHVTFEALLAALGTGDPLRIVYNQCGLSDSDHIATLFKPHELAGSNSLYPLGAGSRQLPGEAITLRNLDDYCDETGVGFIDLLKIDAEGHDFLVLLGSTRMLEAQRIEVVQFEYNYRWMSARRYLRDAIELFATFGYTVGKVTPAGVEWYRHWDPELETMREANYLAARPLAMRRFPSVPWWKDA